MLRIHTTVMPAQAGIQKAMHTDAATDWTPAFAGVTNHFSIHAMRTAP